MAWSSQLDGGAQDISVAAEGYRNPWQDIRLQMMDSVASTKHSASGQLVVITGPRGSGKDAVIAGVASEQGRGV